MPRCAHCGFDSVGPFRFCPECGFEPTAATSHEQRRVVTVVFCDLAGSTALGETVDPERLRVVLAGYFQRMKGIVEAHGGTVEKFIGDAVMAVFGIPVVHEDDALRAVRAAHEMRDALPELGLEGRIGVMTGEVVTGTSERLVTGDAVNVAARLEQAAAPGDVLIGEPTLALVRDAVAVESIEPLQLKGKSEPLPAFRLLRVLEAPERRHDRPFVGRDREVGLLQEAWRRATADRRCELVTIVGEAGVGKSRLVAEALTAVDARIVRCHCLPYGEGITYRPVIEVLKQLDLLPPDATAAAAIRTLLGESDAQTSADEIAWAFRKTLEHAATAQPLVVVFDDIQWGEATFDDLVEHVALLSTGAPILLVCMARPEFAEHRPTWPVTIRLEPLTDSDVEELLPDELPSALREKIGHAAGGNPLFVTEMLAVAAETEGDVVVPPTLRALLAARLDQLQPEERSVLERGAVQGETFHRGAVHALTDDDSPITPHLASLVRKGLILPDAPVVPGDDGFRFRHLLLRDAAYNAVAKTTRAELHHRYAIWLEKHGTSLVELDELAGFHLEQACRYHDELGIDDDRRHELAVRAGRLLGVAGQRAHTLGDDGAARSLLGRAADLLPDGDPELPSLLALLGTSTYESGDVPRALDALERARGAAVASGQRDAELRSRMDELAIRVRLESPDIPSSLTEVEAAVAELELQDDDASLARAWRAMIEIGFVDGDMDLVHNASERLLQCARRTGNRRDEVWAVRGIAAALTYGPAPVNEAIARVEHNLADFPQERAGEDHLALLYAFAGRFDDAERAMERSRHVRRELGQRMDLAMLVLDSTWIALLAGRPDRAEPDLREAAGFLDDAGDRDFLTEVAWLLGEVLYRLDRDEEAENWLLHCSDAAPHTPYWACTLAKVLARRGGGDAALQLSATGVELCRRDRQPMFLGYALCDRAEVFRLLGRPDDARPLLEEALAVYERKGIIPAMARAKEQLAELGDLTR